MDCDWLNVEMRTVAHLNCSSISNFKSNIWLISFPSSCVLWIARLMRATHTLFDRLLQIIRHGVFQLASITKERFEYFSQLIRGCKEMRANSPMEQDDSMLSDYLELLTKPDRPVYFSGNHSIPRIFICQAKSSCFFISSAFSKLVLIGGLSNLSASYDVNRAGDGKWWILFVDVGYFRATIIVTDLGFVHCWWWNDHHHTAVGSFVLGPLSRSSRSHTKRTEGNHRIGFNTQVSIDIFHFHMVFSDDSVSRGSVAVDLVYHKWRNLAHSLFVDGISATVDAKSCPTLRRLCTKCCVSVASHLVCGGTRPTTPSSM